MHRKQEDADNADLHQGKFGCLPKCSGPFFVQR